MNMAILLINQFFWPDTAATSHLLSDVANHLAVSGEDVKVICGTASYGNPNDSPRPDVEIIRLQNAAFTRRFGGRIVSYLTFFLGALWHGLKLDAPAVVMTLTTPPLISLVGLAIQKLRGSRHVIWEMDVYPDVAVDLGVLQADGLLAKIFGWLADLPRRHADRIVVLGECMRARLLAHGIPEEKIVVAENWAERPEPEERRISFRHCRPTEALSIMYSGNLGMAHDAETVAGAMRDLAGRDQEIGFVFAGGGSRHSWLKKFCQEHGISSCEFLPYCERHDLFARLRTAHIGLVTQKNESLGSSVPSKTYGIMAAGRPILFVGPAESTTARIIARYGCGWQVDCGDTEGLVQLLEHLNDNREMILEAGHRAFQAFLTNYQRSEGVARIAAIVAGVDRQSEATMAAGAAFG